MLYSVERSICKHKNTNWRFTLKQQIAEQPTMQPPNAKSDAITSSTNTATISVKNVEKWLQSGTSCKRTLWWVVRQRHEFDVTCTQLSEMSLKMSAYTAICKHTQMELTPCNMNAIKLEIMYDIIWKDTCVRFFITNIWIGIAFFVS